MLTDEAGYYKIKSMKMPAIDVLSALNRLAGLPIDTKAIPDQRQLLVEVINPRGYQLI